MKRKPIYFSNVRSRNLASEHPGNYFVPIVERAKHSVISIETRDRSAARQSDFLFSFLFPQTEQASSRTKSFGTGFIVHPNGYILTSEHVIHNAEQINVRLYSGEQRTAKVVWSDEKRDLAVLQIQSRRSLPPLPIGSSADSKVGEFVLSIGNPMGLEHTVTKGIISAKNRPVRISDKLYEDIIQTDCAINPGNSGGPLINMNGEVIGMNAFIIKNNQGLGFAVGIDAIKERAGRFLVR
ncbi:S1C family serine protease [Ammoniphilus sp. CFH 90114]|uniref:S1C family serine protease n=1 Tax=Ammoniphilus sp. CFH 90114 TaxID=2493665 RepID=UPI00100ED1BC|nr:trypsin-like peptidase domain-containing protein [Ammoniphilus sp. CFH 90114]RXT13470.1 trypsin-like serine protease [Ammoniphilus sp. CFH 90114]